MRFWENHYDYFLLAIRSIISHKLRAFLTTLGIIIGVLTIISLITLVNGFNRRMTNQITGLGSDIFYIERMPWISGEDPYNYRNRKRITEIQAKQLIKCAKLAEKISYYCSTLEQIKFGNKKLRGVKIIGTIPEYQETVNIYPEYGRFLLDYDVSHSHNVCLIGSEVTDKLFNGADPLTHNLKIRNHSFRIIGVLEKKGSYMGTSMDNMVIIPIGAFYKVLPTRTSLSIAVKAVNQDMIEETIDELRGSMRRIRRVPPLEEDDFAVNKQDIFASLYKNFSSALYSVATGIGSISLFVGGIGIMNIMLVTVSERTKEIGIRKAVGAKRSNILYQFIIESITICLIGGIIGTCLGIFVGKTMASLFDMPAKVSIVSIVIGLSFSTLVGLFFGIYPASKAAKLKPIEALRYE